MRYLISIPVFLTLCACGPSADDPIRREFVEACMQMKAYQSVQVDKRNTLCKCSYDAAIKGLSEDAQNAARFYLLEQAGAETASKNLISNPPNVNAMVEASTAIGKAVQQCR